MTCQVFFYVQHLLGVGHLQRAAAIVRALRRKGIDVALVSGGLPLQDLDLGGAPLHQLPPVRTRDAAFSGLVDEQGRSVDDAFKAERAAQLLALYRGLAPKVLLLEMFPFGRRQMRFELLPLLEAARAAAHPPKIVSSLRDVLTGVEKAEKRAWMVKTFRRHFDLLLVHGDPDVLTLEESFADAAALSGSLRYTGYVAAADRTQGESGGYNSSGEVLISAGGGAVAAPLIAALFEAHASSSLKERPWRLLVGDKAGSASLAALRARAPAGVNVEPLRPDFPRLLAGAGLSVSQAGYNTVMDLLLVRVPALLIPFAEGQEGEQNFRARRLAQRGLLHLLPAEDLNPQALAAAMAKAFAAGPPAKAHINLKGAEKTAEILQELLL